ncbi:uncharacterized protein LOC126905833 isoform X2 [Daktulosphaira vitifoliae]|uniref:uncharacterized protein LOC126905833 isoform X2 n=1 Tax=Daktulosphaira vitifoliae TaxID=58002 RepID=UPI0021A9BBEF|nr:uncharacterized protein LOC126905833 isoform X2 [Daktulosphaira vitifoliae]
MSPDRVIHRIVITWSVLLTIFARVQGLKCRTVDHSRRHSEFIDLAEQCNNSTGSNHRLSDRDSFPLSEQGLMNNSGQRIDRGGDGNRRDTTSRMDDRRGSDRRNNNREYSVRRQEYSDRDQDPTSYSCGDNSYGQFPQQRPNYNQDVGQNYYHRGNPYQANSDYDISQSYSRTPTMPPLQMKRYRRHMIRRAASSKLLGNNRFRNATKNGINQTKGSIIDKMDALNSNARPDKSSIVSIMTSQIKDVELKEFVQEAIDECFDTLELDSHSNKCEFSKNFATCMENKAQRNCDDWDLPMNNRGTNL